MNNQNINILLIEDNKGDARLIEIYLHQLADRTFDITHACHLKDGLKLLDEQHFDIILLDLTLPDCTGLDTFKKISDPFPEVPVVVLTGLEDEELGLNAVKLGAQDFLTKKQLESNLLGRSIRYAIERKQASDRLNYHSNILQNVRDSIIVTDTEGNITYWNKGSEIIFGYKAKEMIGQKPLILFPDYPMDEFTEQSEFIFKGNEVSREWRSIRKDGQEIWMDNKISVMKNIRNKPMGLILVGKEITDRKLALEELERHRIALSEAQRLAHLGSYQFDMTNGDSLWSEEMYRIFEKERKTYVPSFEDFIGMIHPDDQKRIRKEFDNFEKADSDFHSEFRIFSTSGILKFLYSIAHPIYDENHRLIRIFGTVLDITERKHYEQKLASNEQRYRTLFHGANDEVLVFKMTPEREPKNFAEINDYTCNLLGYTHAELLKMNIYDIIELEKVDTTSCFNQLFESHELVMECSHVTKDGYTFPVEVNAHLFYLNDDPTVLLIGRDITERRKLEQEILSISEQERRRIGQDLHDGLGQMLTGIGLITKNLARKLSSNKLPGSEELEEIVSLIQEADQQARGLARGLVPVDLEANGLITALKQLTEEIERIFNISCTFESTGTPLVYDNIRALHLYRIAQESISNAIKHGHSTKVSVYLTRNNEHIILRITDNGVGYKNDSRPKQGMGVRIMHYRARIIGGTLNIRKTPRGGTIVSCTVPLSEGPSKNKH